MRQPPLRQRIGRKPLMEYHRRRFHARVAQIGIELRKKLRHDHALVDDGTRRQGGDVEHRIARFEDLFTAPPRHVQLAIEGRLVDIATGVDEHLHDARQRFQGLQAAGAGIDREGAETCHLELLALDFLGENPAGAFGLNGIAIQKHQTGGKPRCQHQPGFRGRLAQKARRHFDQQTAAVAGLAVGRDGATVRQSIERTDGRLQHPMARLVIETRDQTEAARIPLIAGTIEAPVAGPRIRRRCFDCHI